MQSAAVSAQDALSLENRTSTQDFSKVYRPAEIAMTIALQKHTRFSFSPLPTTRNYVAKTRAGKTGDIVEGQTDAFCQTTNGFANILVLLLLACLPTQPGNSIGSRVALFFFAFDASSRELWPLKIDGQELRKITWTSEDDVFFFFDKRGRGDRIS